MELWWLECAGTFIIQTSLLKIGCLVHKLDFVATEVAGTVANAGPDTYIIFGKMTKITNIILFIGAYC